MSNFVSLCLSKCIDFRPLLKKKLGIHTCIGCQSEMWNGVKLLMDKFEWGYF